METEKPSSWKDVLDCKKLVGHMDYMLEIVEKTGYKYFVWNGWVYSFHRVRDGYLTYGTTGMKAEDLK